MIRLITLGCVLLCPGAALACNAPTILIGATGDATYMSPVSDSRAALEDIFGEAPGADMILVVDSRDRSGYWLERSDLGALQVMMNTSGPYPRYSGPDECRPPEIPIDLPDGRPIDAPIELFPDEATGTDPRSGLWRAEVGATATEGCPAMMQDALSSSLGAVDGMTGEPRRLEFSTPFHPDALEMSSISGVRWAADGPDRWVTADLGADALRQIPQGQGGGSQIVWTLTVISPEEISFRRVIEIDFPAEAAALMGASPDGCRLIGTDRWLRVGD